MVKDERESSYRGQRYVLFDGRITNSGNFPLVNVGLDIENITQVQSGLDATTCKQHRYQYTH